MFHTPTIMAIGPARIISPDGTGSIPLELAAQFAAIALLDPGPSLLALWVRRLEDDLGVNEAHRRALETSPQAVVTEIGRNHRRRSKAERQRAVALNASEARVAPETSVASDLKALAQKDREIAVKRGQADLAREQGDRNRHKEMLGRLRALQVEAALLRKKIDLAHGQHRDKRWVAFASSETETLADARGEDFEDEATEVAEWQRDPETGFLLKNDEGMPVLKTERATAKRCLTRAGLERAFVRGDLGEGVHEPIRLREIGRAYRAAYEAAVGRQTPEAKEIRGTGVPEPQASSLRAWEDLNIMRGQLLRDGLTLRRLNARQMLVLDQVCGEDNTLGNVAASYGHGVPSMKRALRAGLDIVGENRKAASAWRAGSSKKKA